MKSIAHAATRIARASQRSQKISSTSKSTARSSAAVVMVCAPRQADHGDFFYAAA
jgi:hypothetical protein